jgi:hypothetical protein
MVPTSQAAAFQRMTDNFLRHQLDGTNRTIAPIQPRLWPVDEDQLLAEAVCEFAST